LKPVIVIGAHAILVEDDGALLRLDPPGLHLLVAGGANRSRAWLDAGGAGRAGLVAVDGGAVRAGLPLRDAGKAGHAKLPLRAAGKASRTGMSAGGAAWCRAGPASGHARSTRRVAVPPPRVGHRPRLGGGPAWRGSGGGALLHRDFPPSVKAALGRFFPGSVRYGRREEEQKGKLHISCMWETNRSL
jgi:hypothetical protein